MFFSLFLCVLILNVLLFWCNWVQLGVEVFFFFCFIMGNEGDDYSMRIRSALLLNCYDFRLSFSFCGNIGVIILLLQLGVFSSCFALLEIEGKMEQI